MFGLKRPRLDVKFGGRTDCSLLHRVAVVERPFGIAVQPLTFYRSVRCPTARNAGQAWRGRLAWVVDLLGRLAEREDVRCSVMTGNLKVTATQKLEHFGLVDYFDGIFGGDYDADRRHLARRTALFLRGAHGHQPSDGTIVIGDTPADILCGLDIDASVMAVCTGNFDRQTLETAGAHVVHQDFSDVDAVYAWLTV